MSVVFPDPMLVTGSYRRSALEGRTEPVAMEAGDWLLIPAHARHRVVFTDPDRETVWLAVHYEA